MADFEGRAGRNASNGHIFSSARADSDAKEGDEPPPEMGSGFVGIDTLPPCGGNHEPFHTTSGRRRRGLPDDSEHFRAGSRLFTSGTAGHSDGTFVHNVFHGRRSCAGVFAAGAQLVARPTQQRQRLGSITGRAAHADLSPDVADVRRRVEL